MKALQYAEYGGPEALRFAEQPLVQPDRGQVRIAVRAAGVNPRDARLRSGRFASEPLLQPAGVGMEFSGTVDALGAGVTTWRIGQAVFGRSAARNAIATYTIADADQIVPKPDWLSHAEAAALPIAVETAYRGLLKLGVAAGKTLLVHAAAGGVGLVATQLARNLGMTVVGTVSSANREAYAKLGAIPVDYAAEGLEERIRAAAPRIDYVFDAYGQGLLGLSLALTGDPARVITIADPKASEYGVHISGMLEMFPVPVVMASALPLVEAGRLALPVEAEYPIDAASEAFARLETGHRRGKIVLTLP